MEKKKLMQWSLDEQMRMVESTIESNWHGDLLRRTAKSSKAVDNQPTIDHYNELDPTKMRQPCTE